MSSEVPAGRAKVFKHTAVPESVLGAVVSQSACQRTESPSEDAGFGAFISCCAHRAFYWIRGAPPNLECS